MSENRDLSEAEALKGKPAGIEAKSILLWSCNAYRKVAECGTSKKPTFLESWKKRDSFKGSWPNNLSDEELLRAWITEYGGYVHPDLHLAPSPTCQGRGWIAGADIDFETVSAEPLMVVPVGLQLLCEDAVAMLRQVGVDVGWNQRLKDLPCWDHMVTEDIPLAVCLAYERSKGRDSPFYPFIRLIPDNAPSLWMKSNTAVKQHLSTLGLRHSEVKRVLNRLTDGRKKYMLLINIIVKYSPFAAALGVTVESIQWALSHVKTRQHSGGISGNIKPVIDSLNHHELAAALSLMVFGENNIMDPPDDALQVLMCHFDGAPRPLKKGDELFVVYPKDRADVPENRVDNVVQFGVVLNQSPAYTPIGKIGSHHTTMLHLTWNPSDAHMKVALNNLRSLLEKEPNHPIKRYVLEPLQLHIFQPPPLCTSPDCPRKLVPVATKQLYCTVCRAPYCSQACQRKNWKSHKRICKPVAARAQS